MEVGEVLGQPQRVPLGDDVEHRADARCAEVRAASVAPNEDAVGHHLVALVLEVVLGQPERVVAEPLGSDAQVDAALGARPALVLGEAPVGGGRRAGAGVVHLDATEEEHADLHRDLPDVRGCPDASAWSGVRILWPTGDVGTT